MSARGEAPAAAGRYDELEAYRGIAALLVVVFHAYQYSREGTGRAEEVYAGRPIGALFHNLEAAVAWFFVLSGFLLFLPIARAAIERGPGEGPRGFLIRRAVRILPPYYLAFLLVWAWRFREAPGQWRDLALHLTFTQVFDRRQIFWTIGPAWSLAIEAIFYLFLAFAGPPAVALCARLVGRGARIAALTGGCVVLFAGSAAYKWWAGAIARVPETDFPAWFGPAAKFDLFAIGMLLAILVAAMRGRAPFGGPAPAILRLAGGALTAAAFLLRADSRIVGLYFHTLAGVGFALVLASTALGPRESAWGRALRWRGLQYLGLISYSVYLWHEAILVELGGRGVLIRQVPDLFPRNALILAALTSGVASLVYWGVERPTLALRFLFTREGRLADHYAAQRETGRAAGD